MAALPYIQLFPADYLADTQHLTLEQHGAYLLLIMNYWQTGNPLRANDQRMASICSTSVEKWLEIKPIIMEFFEETTEEGTQNRVWMHERIEFDLLKVLNKSTKAQRAGKKSAKQRAEIKKESNERTNDRTNHTDTDTDTDNKTPCIKPPAKKRANGTHFERFWAHWPIKRNKKRAKDVFMRKKFTPEDVEELILDVENRKKSDKQWQRGYVPHCSTYLNGHRWEDTYGR